MRTLRGLFLGKNQIFRFVTSQLRVPTNTSDAQATSQNAAAPGEQVDDQDDQREHQQKVNQATGCVETETQKPQNKKNNEDCPRHRQHTLSALKAPETGTPAQAPPNALTNARYSAAIAFAFARLTASMNESADAGVATSPRRTRCVETSCP